MVTSDSRNRRFFVDLEPNRDFKSVFTARGFEDLPADWFLIRVDVLDPAPTWDAGRDLELFTALSMVAMALANLENGLDFAMVYGGDHLTVCLPPDNYKKIRSVLADSRAVVRNLFQLELRLALIPIEAVARSGHPIQAAKFKVSTFYDQVCLVGPGLDHAARLIRGREADPQFLLPTDEPITAPAQFSGLSTRWQPVRLPGKEIVSLILKPKGNSSQEIAGFERLLGEIDNLLGADYQPVNPTALHLSLNKTALRPEAQALTRERASLKTLGYVLGCRLAVLGTKLAGLFNLPVRRGHRVLSQLKAFTTLSSAWRSVDGCLQMVVALSPENRVILEGKLNSLYRDQVLNFGLHVAPAARIVSLVHSSNRKEVHLVDGLGGGLGQAARMFRQQATGE